VRRAQPVLVAGTGFPQSAGARKGAGFAIKSAGITPSCALGGMSQRGSPRTKSPAPRRITVARALGPKDPLNFYSRWPFIRELSSEWVMQNSLKVVAVLILAAASPGVAFARATPGSRAAELSRAYLAAWSSNEATTLSRLKQVYAPQVRFYGGC